MKDFLCRMFGHQEIEGPLKRSPNTAYTHWRDLTCARCGEDMGTKREYHDARTEPELFRSPRS